MCPLLTRQRSGAPSVPEGTEAAPLTDHQGTLTAAPQDRSLEFLVAAVRLLCARRGECSLLATLHTISARVAFARCGEEARSTPSRNIPPSSLT